MADGRNTVGDAVMNSESFLFDDDDVLLVEKPSGAHFLVEVVQFDVLRAVATNYFFQRLSRREKKGYVVMWRTGGV